MAEPKRRDRPKGYYIRESLKPKAMQKKPSGKGYAASGALGAEAAAAAADVVGATDPYLSRNEFKEGFYDQLSKPGITAETMYGKGTKKSLESPIVDPDTSMMQGMAEGGSVRGQKNIQVKKKVFKGIF
jgi:hypothetical protein